MTQNKFEIFNALFPLAVVSGPLLVVATVIFPVIAGILILSQPAADTRAKQRAGSIAKCLRQH